MSLIETQSKETLSNWAVKYVKENYLPILTKQNCADIVLEQAIENAELYKKKEIALKELKPYLAEQEFQKVFDSLAEVAAPDEKNPVKIDWNC